MHTAILLFLVVLGAYITRSVWRMGFQAGVSMERARTSMARAVAVLEQVERERGA